MSKTIFSDSDLKQGSRAELEQALMELGDFARGLNSMTGIPGFPPAMREPLGTAQREIQRIEKELGRRNRWHQAKRKIAIVTAGLAATFLTLLLAVWIFDPATTGLVTQSGRDILVIAGMLAIVVSFLMGFISHVRFKGAEDEDRGLLWSMPVTLLGGLFLFTSWALGTPREIVLEGTRSFFWFVFVMFALVAIPAGVRPAYRWLSRISMKRHLGNAAVVLSVFVIAVFASRRWYDLEDGEPLLAGAAVTVIVVFLYWRIARKLEL